VAAEGRASRQGKNSSHARREEAPGRGSRIGVGLRNAGDEIGELVVGETGLAGD
jgi:hypothetical protein